MCFDHVFEAMQNPVFSCNTGLIIGLVILPFLVMGLRVSNHVAKSYFVLAQP